MTSYRYKALDHDGNWVKGWLDAIDALDLDNRLRRVGLDLVHYRQSRNVRLTPFQRRVRRQALIQFCIHLEYMTRAGVPILEGLLDYQNGIDNTPFQSTIAGLIDAIKGGHTLSQALEKYPKVFDPLFISMIRVGEQSGHLDTVFRDLTDALKWQDELVARSKKILIYPIFVGITVLGALVFLMTNLVPQMVIFIRDLGETLPFHTRALIAVSDTFSDAWHFMVGIPLAFALLIHRAAHISPTVRFHIDKLKLLMWPTGSILRKLILARFSAYFALMYRSGISILESLAISEQLTGNAVFGNALRNVRQRIEQGAGLTASFESTGLFPPLMIRMLRVGENTGELDEALHNVSYFYGREVKETIDKMQSMIEPVLTLVLGAITGWLMLAVLGPIYDVISKVRI